MSGVIHVDCPGCGAPIDPRTTDGHTIRCGYCGAVGVVRREGGRLVVEPTVLGAAADSAVSLWRRVDVAIAGVVGIAVLVVVAAQALRPSMGTPVFLALLILFASFVLRIRANPLLGPLLALSAGLTLALKPFVVPLRIGRFSAFSPTSETAFHWLVPGVILTALALLMVGTLTRARIAGAARRLVPGWRSAAIATVGLGLGLLVHSSVSGRTLFEQLELSAPMLDQLDARLAAARGLRATGPVPADVKERLRTEPDRIDVLLRSELGAEAAPDARYVTTGVLSPLIELRRQLRTPDQEHYMGDLHEPMHDGRRRAFARAEALRYLVIVDLTPEDPQLQPSGTVFTATGTVVDLEGPVVFGAVTGPADVSAYSAIVRLQETLGIPRER